MRTIITNLILTICCAWPVLAHDTGFGHSRRALHISYTDGAWVLEYRLRMNADEALVEMTLIDQDDDGQITDTERNRFFQTKGRNLLEGIICIDPGSGHRITGALDSWQLGPSLTQTFVFKLPTSAVALALDDRNFAHKHGQLVVHLAEGLALVDAADDDYFHVDRVQLQVTREPRNP